MSEQFSEEDIYSSILLEVKRQLRPLNNELLAINNRVRGLGKVVDGLGDTQLKTTGVVAALSKLCIADIRRVDALINLAGIDPDMVRAEVRRMQQAIDETSLAEAKVEHAAAVVRMVKHAEKAEGERFDFENPKHSGGATAPGIFALRTPPRAEAGAKGDKGDTGPAPSHEWEESKLRFSNPDGTWGEFVDLLGKTGNAPEHEVSGGKIRFKNSDGTWGKWVTAPKGEPGKPGKDGGIIVIRSGGSSSGVDLSALPGGDANAEPASIPVMQGGRLVNLPWSGFLSVITGALDTGSDHARREDFASETVLYRGEAAPGTAEDAAAWKIRRVEFFPDGDVTTTFAAGNAEFVHVWADRAALQYS